MTGIEELRELNRKLETLLADPEPGLYLWMKSVHDTLLEMALFCGDGRVIVAVNDAKAKHDV